MWHEIAADTLYVVHSTLAANTHIRTLHINRPASYIGDQFDLGLLLNL